MPKLVNSLWFIVNSHKKTTNHEPRTIYPDKGRTNRKSFGFTLIELLVVVAILATLGAAIIYSTDNTREKGKDARRKGDLNAISSALVSYYADHGHYPEDGSNPVVLDYASESGDDWIPGLNEYLPKRPKDPLQASIDGFVQKAKLTLNVLIASLSSETYSANNSSPEIQVAGTATATIGQTSIGPYIARCCPAGRLTGSLFLMPNDGTVTSMSVYIGEVDSSQNHYRMAIYSNIVVPELGGVPGPFDIPGSVIANTDQGVLSSPNTWNTLPIAANLTANTKYWLLFNTNGTNIPMGFLTDKSVLCGVGFLAPNLNQFPDGTNPLLDTNLNSIYATYTYTTPGAPQTPLCTPDSGGGPPPPTPPPPPGPPDLPGGGSSGICDNKSGIYCYRVSLDKKNFILWAQLENLNDPDIYNNPTTSYPCNRTSDATIAPPSGSFLNFCIRSPR